MTTKTEPRTKSSKPQGGDAEHPIEKLAIDTIRTLSMDAVQQANSGHPGTPMALAPMVYTLWQRFLRYDPADPAWPNRDRFVLSNGHASMLLYSILHLTGVSALGPDGKPKAEAAVSLDDIRHFRQLGSRCPGHPEYGHTAGVETTTGPLGQGCGTSVGMAMAQRWLAQHFNKPDLPLFDYDIYVSCSDGDMMEGISNEAASLAGHLMLGNLCWIYDNNTITIEGHTDAAFSDDVAARFLAYGWDVVRVGDANDTGRIAEAIERFRRTKDVPTLIILDSHIGYGAPHKHDTAEAHGEALGVEEVRLAKRFYGWPEDAKFLVPEGVRDHFRSGIGDRGKKLHAAWSGLLEEYRKKYPAQAAQFDQMEKGELPDGWDKDIPNFATEAKGLATRESSGKVLNAVAAKFPWLIGGAADLAPSTKTRLGFESAGDFGPGKYAGRNLHFGIREHTMGAIVNGLTLSKLRAYGSTFLIFSDYMKPAIRLGALMDLPIIHIFTHDSIGLGEDGPTHQPIEQLLSLRSIPGLVVFRPADANEVAAAWRHLIAHKQPTCLALSRQPLPTLDRGKYGSADGVARGAYVLADAGTSNPSVILIGTGSEVAICLAAYEKLERDGIAARVVSMPSWELFEAQDQAYRDSVLPQAVTARVSVEAASVIGWDRYVGATGAKIGMRSFGASAPIKEVYAHFGFTAEAVVAAAKQQIALSQERAV